MWKPGQIVTVGGKKYRITTSRTGGCFICEHSETPIGLEPCLTCLHGYKMPLNCYLKEIKPNERDGLSSCQSDNYQNNKAWS